MNNNGNSGEVNHNLNGDRFRIVKPGDEITELRERIASLEGLVVEKDKRIEALQMALSKLLIARTVNAEAKPASEVSNAPTSRPLPEEDKTIDRAALCNELVRVCIELGRELGDSWVGTPKFAHGDRANKPRVHFAEDNSFLYFDPWGRLLLGKPNETSKGRVARRVLKQLYFMREHLRSPILQAALLKTQFNVAVSGGKRD
jgi:hypothetical protein